MALTSSKICTKCKRDLPLSAFGKHSVQKDGLTYDCRECRNARSKRRDNGDYHLRRRYGITAAQRDELIAAQDGKCAGCGRGPGAQGFHVDHDHKTGKVRGILCHSCNSGLGLFDDDPEILRRLADYLETSNEIEQLEGWVHRPERLVEGKSPEVRARLLSGNRFPRKEV